VLLTQVLGIVANYNSGTDKFKMQNVIVSAKGGDEENLNKQGV
jgi:hypothetical protein